MAIKSQNQVTIIDITDAYSAILTNENQTFAEASPSSGIAIGAATTTNARAWRGSEEMYVWVDNVSASSTSNYISISHGNATEATQDLQLTITFGTSGHAINSAGTIDIPILVFSEAVDSNITDQNSKYLTTLHKTFSYSIARYGNTGAAPTVYELNFTSTAFSFDNETATVSPNGITITATSIQGTTRASFTSGYVEVKKSDGTSKMSKTQIGNNGQTFYCGVSSTDPETLYYTVNLYETNASTAILDSQTIAINRNGANGADAYSLDITSSGGLIFKNDNGTTVLTAHVYKGGVELDSSDYDDDDGFDGLGLFVNWYDGNSCIGNGLTYPDSGSISASTIQNTKTYTAKLEDSKGSVIN